MRLSLVGTGYVGLVTGACLANLGHTVFCIDIDQEKIANLKRGKVPFYEPGLENLVQHNQQAKRLFFSTSLQEIISKVEIIIIAVGTPSLADGRADLRFVWQVVEEISKNIKSYKIIVTKSTVPVGTNAEIIKRIKKKYKGEFDIVSCPEFLREGSAIADFTHPDRIIIGVSSTKAKKIIAELFANLSGEKLFTTLASAELIKYAANAFLATKISFINEIAHLCERAGADVEEVAYGLGLDHRVGKSFLKAGIGWGGSCFPKDVRALKQIAGSHGYNFQLLQAVIKVNQHQREHFVNKVKNYFKNLRNRRLAIFGLAFKANTDDIRESAAIEIIQKLLKLKAKLDVFDYQAQKNAQKILQDAVTYYDDVYECAKDNEAILLLTEWSQFRDLDWRKIKTLLKRPVIFDGRNLLNPKHLREIGFKYFAIGRP